MMPGNICLALAALVVVFTHFFGECRWVIHIVRLLFMQQPGNTLGIYFARSRAAQSIPRRIKIRIGVTSNSAAV
jgi:hypothetical protein